MSITWHGRLEPFTVDSPSLITDLAPTVLALLGIESPRSFSGFDWSGVMRREEEPPDHRITHYQAHKGAVLSQHQSELARRAGLLELALIDGSMKEIYRIDKRQRRLFDLRRDPGENESLTIKKAQPSETLQTWIQTVTRGLTVVDEVPAEPLDPESAEQLRSLGYLE
jgi:arylsulfatase A-like enzyme